MIEVGERVELLLGQEMVVEYSLGKVGVREAGLDTEKRAELVQKMGEAPLVDGSLGYALNAWRAGKAGL